MRYVKEALKDTPVPSKKSRRDKSNNIKEDHQL